MHGRTIPVHRKPVYSLINSAVNMALPAFAAERRYAARAAATLLLGAAAVDRYLVPVRRPAANSLLADAAVE